MQRARRSGNNNVPRRLPLLHSLMASNLPRALLPFGLVLTRHTVAPDPKGPSRSSIRPDVLVVVVVCENSDGPNPGEIEPVPVLTRTRRRTKRGDWNAICWASPPPHDSPSTSAREYPSFRSILTARYALPGNPYGTGPAGDPPTPGTSKRTTSIAGSTASTKGCSTSKPTPMPQHRSKGTAPSVPGRIRTRRSWPRTLMTRVASTVEHIGARRGLESWEAGGAEQGGCLFFLTRAFGQPVGVVGPPATGLRAGCLEPLVRVGDVVI